jgi:UDPglucose 6-dehydrogenase
MKKIVVVGAGYVGLVTGVCLAQKNNSVIVVEHNQDKIQMLSDGQVPFYEPGINDYVSDGIALRRLVFVTSVAQALEQNPEVIFLCVGTPSNDDGSADLSQVWTVAREIGKYLNTYCVVVNKSTVPVGTARQVEAIINEELALRNVSVPFDVASNPEFLKEGDALNDFICPDRVVVGVTSPLAEHILYQLYKPFIADEEQFVVMNRESAELTKYAANAMLATRISFVNQIALLADKVGANIDHIKQGIAKDKRIGAAFLNAGIGYGGSCFPKDVKALVHMGIEYQQPMTLVQEVDRVNSAQRIHFVQTILNHYGTNIAHKHAGIWGLSFKPETDDIRYAPALEVIQKLREMGTKITAYDPIAINNIKAIVSGGITYATTPEQVLHACDFLIILTEWKVFLHFQPTNFLALKDKTIFDGRNCFDPAVMTMAGLTYVCIGKNSARHDMKHLGSNQQKRTNYEQCSS